MQSYQRFQYIVHTVFNTSGTNAPRLLSRAKVGIHTRLSEKDRTQGHTRRNRGCFGRGVVSLPSARSTRSQTSPGRVSERRTLPLLGLGRGESRRTQRAFGTAMRSCASLSRGVAAPLGCATFLLLSKLRLVRPALRVFPRVRGGGGITTLGALCVLLKRWTAACQSG